MEKLDLTQNTFTLAKQIRQEGEDWQSAIQRATQLKNSVSSSATKSNQSGAHKTADKLGNASLVGNAQLVSK